MHKQIASAQVPVAHESPAAALVNFLKKAKELIDACDPRVFMDLADAPNDVIRRAANYAAVVRGLSGKIYEKIESQAEDNESGDEQPDEQANTCGKGEHKPARKDKDEYVNDSWIGECEAAGVYSRTTPVYRYEEQPDVAVMLTRSELRLLAQRHLNTALMYGEFLEWNRESDIVPGLRATRHRSRFWQLCDQLPPEDQNSFEQQIEIRQRYIKTVAKEVERCRQEDVALRDRVAAGLASEAEVAANSMLLFMEGYNVMPIPADGGPGPEVWQLFDL